MSEIDLSLMIIESHDATPVAPSVPDSSKSGLITKSALCWQSRHLFSLRNALTTHLNLIVLMSSSLNMAAQRDGNASSELQLISMFYNRDPCSWEHEVSNIDMTSFLDPRKKNFTL